MVFIYQLLIVFFFVFFVFFFSRFVNITASKPRLYIAGLPVCQL